MRGLKTGALVLVALAMSIRCTHPERANALDWDALTLTNAIYHYSKFRHLGFCYGQVSQIVHDSFDFERQHPNKPYKAEDLIAVAWVESQFNPYAIGAAGERGAWQVLNWRAYLRCVQGHNAFDVETNLEMASAELDAKFSKYSDFKTSIVAYNGMRYRDNGSLDDTYYKEVLEKKNLILGMEGVGVGEGNESAGLASRRMGSSKDEMEEPGRTTETASL